MPTINDNEVSLAVLIDADNTPYRSIGQVLDHCHKFGNAVIKRAYGDWSRSNLKEWDSIFREYAIKPMQQFQYTNRKNSTDIAMVIDAMDMLHTQSIGAFILITSDSDFTALAIRIREQGIKVIGIGRKTAPTSFVKGCEEFVYIENLVTPLDKENTEEIEIVQIASAEVRDGRELLIKAIQNTVDENGIVLGSNLGLMLIKIDPSFSPKNYGFKKLSKFIDQYPDILLFKEMKGGDMKYKVVDSNLG